MAATKPPCAAARAARRTRPGRLCRSRAPAAGLRAGAGGHGDLVVGDVEERASHPHGLTREAWGRSATEHGQVGRLRTPFL